MQVSFLSISQWLLADAGRCRGHEQCTEERIERVGRKFSMLHCVSWALNLMNLISLIRYHYYQSTDHKIALMERITREKWYQKYKVFCDWSNRGRGIGHVEDGRACYSSQGNLKLNEAGLSSINGSCFPRAGQVLFFSQAHLHRLMEASGSVIYSFLRLIKVITVPKRLPVRHCKTSDSATCSGIKILVWVTFLDLI